MSDLPDAPAGCTLIIVCTMQKTVIVGYEIPIGQNLAWNF